MVSIHSAMNKGNIDIVNLLVNCMGIQDSSFQFLHQ